MNSSMHVVFLAKGDDALVNLARDLSRLGFAVHMHRDPGTLHSAFVLDQCPLILVGLPMPDLNDAVMKIRALHPTAGVLACSTFDNSEQRVRTLLSGADQCVELSTSTVEVAALLRVLQRRGIDILASAHAASGHAQALPASAPLARLGPTGMPSLWRVANKGWTLVAPSGRALALTAGERELMQRFFASADRKIRRDPEEGQAGSDPIARGVSMGGESAANAAAVSPRVIDVMISRLRRKASKKQMGLPIRAVPGWGYVFAGDLESIDDVVPTVQGGALPQADESSPDRIQDDGAACDGDCESGCDRDGCTAEGTCAAV